MSLVGPRPEDLKYVVCSTPEQWVILSVRPGMASPAAMAFQREKALLSDVPPEQIDKVYLIVLNSM